MIARTAEALRQRLAPRRMFSEQPEESLRLRVLMLAALWWVALALNWVAGDPLLIFGASAAASLGHWISWRQRHVPLGLMAVPPVLLIAVVSFAMRNDLLNAVAGDRLPVAEYLLIVQAIASFALRTRGGLYAGLGLSGLMLFFVAERAFEPMFVAFLIAFMGVFLTFWAIAFLEDELRRAKVHHWPEGQLGRVWFWLGMVGGGLLVCSALAFSLLPSDYRGKPGAQRAGVLPFMGEEGSPEQAAARRAEASESARREPAGEDARTRALLDELARAGAPESSALAPEGFEPPKAALEERDVVMHVRSRVTSYWRGQVYHEFDGGTWRRSDRYVLGVVDPRNRSYYWQTYFVQTPQPGLLFMGYNPVRVILPDDVTVQGQLAAGSAYSVLSQQPDLRVQDVRADHTGPTGQAYLALPALLEERLKDMAREIAPDSLGAFDRVWRVVSYLRQRHAYSPGTEARADLSSSQEQFLFGDSAGDAVDFATATVLLSRASGLPARLAVGYLPGRFDPFSGSHNVRQRDAHAWAEVLFARHGWIAFDSAPRPELARFVSGRFAQSPRATFIFQTRVGGGLYQALSRGSSDAADEIAGAIKRHTGLLTRVVAIIGGAAVALTAIWMLKRRRGVRARGPTYSHLSGVERARVLRAYKGLERWLRRLGVAPRGPSQSLAEYARAASQRIDGVAAELGWFTRAAWVAAYSPGGPGPQLAREAEERLARLRATGRRKVPPRR